ncbi:aminotransferase class V-fold PLP-dependent enzyme [Halalkaliarchaeum sp. AArc-GB]|uniref:aminotransferase class V-fold PLP-dependent enzyme n=1 Tax=Halalkaliarchaeum sp. AArc-GB TaxID=3074078 RepID=UPI00285A1A34|nr:aminotransferase class V-fold PLP-dependent enzyme [Halalkaliarchaeum sp. AArc-GB]MDR5671783.1 aminotransferase class V-fold PLP-dependent enzyme [Halalkaliarchaeum sp. AArc-GB]
MKPAELRSEIPAVQNVAYMNTGASGPSPRRVVEAAHGYLKRVEYDVHASGDIYEFTFGEYERIREEIAEFVGASPAELALTESTTDGIARFASGIDWEPGDIVVRTDLEHPAGILPWQRLEREGVEVRVVETENGRIDLDEFTDAVSDAKLACFSALTWTHGTRLPISELADIAREAGALTLVDAVQVPGQAPFDVEEWGADAVASAGHKWLLGLWGGGFLYVRREVADRLEPRSIGYRSVQSPGDSSFRFKQGAPRLEIGTTNLAAHVGLLEAIETMESVGLETIQGRIRDLTDRFKAGVPDERLLSPREYESGLVTVDVSDPEETVERLDDAGFTVRSIPPMNAVRISLHVFNTPAEVDALLAELDWEL